MIYPLADTFGPNCITYEDGQTVYDWIYPHLVSHSAVELDFAGVTIVASPFLNAAVGQLLKDVSLADVEQYLVCTNMPAYAQSLLNRIMETSALYYTDPAYQQAVDEALTEVLHELSADYDDAV